MGFNLGGAPARVREGEFLAGIKRGTLVIKNVETFEGYGGDKFQITAVLKDGVEAAEQLGPKDTQTRVGDTVVVQQDPDQEGGSERIIADLECIVGPGLPSSVKGEPEHPNNVARLEAFNALLRADANGFTKSGTPCPAAGYELKFTCNKVKTKKGAYIYPPKFTHVDMTSEQAAANAKEYFGE